MLQSVSQPPLKNKHKLFQHLHPSQYRLKTLQHKTEEDSGISNSLDITQQNNSLDITQQDNAQPEQQISHIQSPTSTPTSTITNSTPTTTQSDYTRQSYRVPSYYANSLSYVNSRRRRRMHTQTQNKERKHKKKDDN